MVFNKDLWQKLAGLPLVKGEAPRGNVCTFFNSTHIPGDTKPGPVGGFA